MGDTVLSDWSDEHCPLCGANPIEHGERYPSDAAVLTQWADSIERLWERLQDLKAQKERESERERD